jgi:hypothetical protein
LWQYDVIPAMCPSFPDLREVVEFFFLVSSLADGFRFGLVLLEERRIPQSCWLRFTEGYCDSRVWVLCNLLFPHWKKKSHLTFDHLFQAEDRPLPSIFFTTCCFLGKKKKTTRKDFRPSFIAVLFYCSCSLFRVQMFMFGVQCMSRGCLHPFLPSFLVAPK